MPRTITRTPAPGTTRRTMTAAARAAAKRVERAETTDREQLPPKKEAPEKQPRDEKQPKEQPKEQPENQGAPREKAGPRRLGTLTAALCVLLLAGLAATAVLGWRYREGTQTEQARAQALAAAQQAAPVVLSYDYHHLNRDFTTARTHLTGRFATEYGKTTTTVVAPTATKYHGVVKATVAAPAGGTPAASVVSATPDQAVILLFVNQVTTSTQTSGPRVDLNRVRMTMTRTSAGWKVSGVDAL